MSHTESIEAPSVVWDLEPEDFIDRTAEQELFRKLVTYQSAARVLTISDAGGRGKSSLLKKLQYNCDYEIEPAVPSCLIELDKLKDPSPFAFAAAVAKGFKVRGESVRGRFERFTALNNARLANKFTPFEGGVGSSQASGTSGRALAGTNYGQNIGTQNIGMQAQIEHVDTLTVSGATQFTEDQEQHAKEACVEALFDDVSAICAEDPLVLILDGWERCDGTLSRWIVDRVFANHLFHRDVELRPKKLAVVIAGRPHAPGVNPSGLRPDHLRRCFSSEDDFRATVLSRQTLSKWESDHIRRFMENNGCPKPTDVEIALIREYLDKGNSLVEIRSALKVFISMRELGA